MESWKYERKKAHSVFSREHSQKYNANDLCACIWIANIIYTNYMKEEKKQNSADEGYTQQKLIGANELKRDSVHSAVERAFVHQNECSIFIELYRREWASANHEPVRA